MARTLVRWEPTTDLLSLPTGLDGVFDRWFEDLFFSSLTPFTSRRGTLPLDIYETDDSVIVKAAIPGVKAEDIDISVAGDVLTIKAETQEEQEVEADSYLRRERRYGLCRRSVTLPGGLETDKAEADYQNGILTLTFPKAEELKPKTIKVKTK